MNVAVSLCRLVVILVPVLSCSVAVWCEENDVLTWSVIFMIHLVLLCHISLKTFRRNHNIRDSTSAVMADVFQ